MRTIAAIAGIVALCACSESPAPDKSAAAPVTTTGKQPDTTCDNLTMHGMPLFGDVHVHTSYSFDAAANSTGATPADAQRYAQGEPIPFFPIGEDGSPQGTAQIDRPLDFLAVTDHGEFLGERALCRDPESPAYDTDFCVSYRSDERQGMRMLGTVITTETPARIPVLCGSDGARCRTYAKTPWQDIQEAANAANQPCKFTSFIAYEYTGTPGTSNYHRNVIFRSDKVPALPVSYIDAPVDSQLWASLDDVCAADDGCDYLTIPHNSNLANGRMAPYRKLPDNLEAKRAYARTRLDREPIMEIFQHKGGSECINGLSSVFGAPDELCNIEAVRHMGKEKTYLASQRQDDGTVATVEQTQVTAECAPGEEGDSGMLGAGCVDPTDFQRSALLIGLREEQSTGFNPVKLGVIAATDTHSATPGGVGESSWRGAVTGEATPKERLEPGVLTSGIDGNPGGLAGVWARENTRDAIFDAMLRREVFGTSGPRIVPRFFAGWQLDANLCGDEDMVAKAYEQGIPMGADLAQPGAGDKPEFLAYAMADPAGRPLQALHLIKGWVDDTGRLHNTVIPVAESTAGAGTLCAVYTDEAFDPGESAYYYLRAVEPPSPRWHTYDCARIAEDKRPDVCRNGAYPDTIREMAWSSPIWYRGVSDADGAR